MQNILQQIQRNTALNTQQIVVNIESTAVNTGIIGVKVRKNTSVDTKHQAKIKLAKGKVSKKQNLLVARNSMCI